MKKLFAIIMMVVALTTACEARDHFTRDVSVLPTQAQQTLKKYFTKVNHIKIDKGLLGVDGYDVILTDGTEVEFNSNGDIKEVESYKGVPKALMPKALTEYVARNHSGAKIVKLDVDRNKYEIELDNGIELEFDRSGRFLRMDR